MAAGLTDHRWTVLEWLSFKVPHRYLNGRVGNHDSTRAYPGANTGARGRANHRRPPRAHRRALPGLSTQCHLLAANSLGQLLGQLPHPPQLRFFGVTGNIDDAYELHAHLGQGFAE